MPRDTEPITVEPNGEERHPAFALVTLHRVHSTGSPMFQSDLLHHQFVRVKVHEAVRRRDLSHDWTHPEKAILAFDMSLAQWGAFVSAVGDGSGTPATLYHREGFNIPDIPYQPRLQASVDETKGAVERVIADIKTAFDDLEAAEENKAGVKERRALRNMLRSKIANASSNAGFAVKTVHEAVEKAVQSAKSDIEVLVAQAAQRHGVDPSIEMPRHVQTLAVEGPAADGNGPEGQPPG